MEDGHADFSIHHMADFDKRFSCGRKWINGMKKNCLSRNKNDKEKTSRITINFPVLVAERL